VHRKLQPLIEDGSISVGPDRARVLDRARLHDHANIN
jgi:hypothetical protein